MKIIHCLYDDKFIDGTIRVYESDKRHSNKYVLVCQNPEKYTFKYIRSEKVETITPKAFLLIASNYDVVILHSFACLKNYYIAKIPEKCKVVWYGWGFDIYGRQYPIVPLRLYSEETQKFIKNYHPPKKTKNQVAEILTWVKKYSDKLWQSKAISRVEYFSGVFPYEYDLIRRYHKNFKARKVDFYYGDIDFFIKDTVSSDIEHGKVNIIIGNSADPRNNHLDALKALAKVKPSIESQVIIPLSYAGPKAYVKQVKDYAESLFPGRVKALLDYMPLQDYLDLTSHCKVAIFYHERQQASDNIFMQMMYGAKVFMSETSLAYQYLKREGFVVYSLQTEADKLLEEISDNEVMKNRMLLCEKYARHTILERVIKINQQIEDDIQKES